MKFTAFTTCLSPRVNVYPLRALYQIINSSVVTFLLRAPRIPASVAYTRVLGHLLQEGTKLMLDIL